jgi:hypothetical protein
MSTDSSVHDIFEEEAADRDLPSPYMEKHFAKFEGLHGVLQFEVLVLVVFASWTKIAKLIFFH